MKLDELIKEIQDLKEKENGKINIAWNGFNLLWK